MPTYEYECQECGHHFDVFQSMLEDPYKTCPVCKGKVKRLISPGAGLIFKGSGFYITDYKKKETAVQGPMKKDTSKETSKGKESSKGSESTKNSSPKKEE